MSITYNTTRTLGQIEKKKELEKWPGYTKEKKNTSF